MQSEFITIQNIRIRINQQGSGQPVVFVHGHPDSADMWAQVIENLPSGFRCIAPDLPGYGQSEAADSFDWSFPNRGKWVADILDALNISEPVALVGHDHGGPFVISFALQYPERVKQQVLQNTLFHSDYEWHIFAKLWRTPLIGEYLAFWQRFRITLPIAQFYMKRGSPLLTNEYIANLQKTWTPRMGRAMLALYRASTPHLIKELEAQFSALIGEKPTLVLWGDRDTYLPVRFAEGWAKDGAKLVRYPDAGHWLAVEKPAEYAQQLAAFLQAD